MLEFKTRTLTDLGAAPAAELHTVPVDLRDDWPAALRDNGFDPQLPTAWIAEGLLIYLPPEAQDRLFDNITALSAPGSRLATEHMDAALLTEKWSERVSEWSKKVGSDVDLMDLFYSGERTSARDHLTASGWGRHGATHPGGLRVARFPLSRGARRSRGRFWITCQRH